MALTPPGATRARPAGVRDDLGHVSPAWRAADGPGRPVCARMSAADLTRPAATPRTGVWPAFSGPGDRSGRFTGPGTEPLRILLVEDDAGDAFLVGELLAEAGTPADLRVVESLAEALPQLSEVDCVLLDLGLPDASGLEGLRQLLRTDSRVAVCVLTGLADEPLGIAALAEGAQDYLVKGKVDGVLLTRALRYAVERRRAEDNTRRLREAELSAAESARLERGLLPQPLIQRVPGIEVHTFYRPGRKGVLGGDFYDVIQTAPRRLSMLVGDVSGHGVEEAALGVELRAAWRALTLAGVPDDALLAALERVLITERRSEEIFATLAALDVGLDGGAHATVRLCGHPPPLVVTGDSVRTFTGEPQIMLGILPGSEYRPAHLDLPDGDWALLVYTDGLIEGRIDDGEDGRLGVDGLTELVRGYRRRGLPLDALPDWLVGQAEERNGGALADDVAMLLLTKAAEVV
jgi:serine phosphatase RsbU (regulator of sigma subunit)